MYTCCCFGVFLRETARTVAKSRTNISINSGTDGKRLDRLAPNVAHMCCRFILEWIGYTPSKLPLETQGALAGYRGSTIQKSGETAGPICTNFGSRLRIHLGMDVG